MPRSYPGSTPGIDPWSQGVIPRRFKRKKNFVTDGLMDGQTDVINEIVMSILNKIGENSMRIGMPSLEKGNIMY